MTQDDGTHEHRHPDAVAYLEGLGEGGAAVVRTREGGCTRYWLQDGEVRSLDVPEDRPLEALLAAVSAEFTPSFRSLRRLSRWAFRISRAWSGRSGTPLSAAARQR